MKVSVIAIGSELLNGDVSESNSQYLVKELSLIGVEVTQVRVIPDNCEQIVEVLKRECLVVDLVLVTGGLGPTSDDLTRDAVAKCLGLSLKEDEGSLEKLKIHAEKRGRELNQASCRQAVFPEGARVISNKHGTANAFYVVARDVHHKPIIYCLPGVPFEMRILFEEEVKPLIHTKVPGLQRATPVCLSFFGVAESHLAQVIDDLQLDDRIECSYRPGFPCIVLSLRAGKDLAESLPEVAMQIKQAVGREFVFSESPSVSFAESLVRLLGEKKKTLAVAESCTGGLVSDMLVRVPGVSEHFFSGVVSYSNKAKQGLLGVEKESLKKYGAVSKEVALEMARGIRRISSADIALSTTGIAGPEGGSSQKPVGTLWIACVWDSGEQAFCYHLNYERNAMRKYSAYLALDKVRRLLSDYPLD